VKEPVREYVHVTGNVVAVVVMHPFLKGKSELIQINQSDDVARDVALACSDPCGADHLVIVTHPTGYNVVGFYKGDPDN
jgi:hypothetical protein